MSSGNGAGPDIKITASQLQRNVVQAGGVMRVVYNRTDGVFMGSIDFIAVSNEALQLMANDFQNFVAAQTGGIAIVGSPAPGRITQ